MEEGATLADLFAFTSRQKMNLADGDHRQLPDHWVIDWERMTLPPRPGSGGAEQIDLTFAADMLSSVGEEQVTEHGSILFRNLLRGFHRRIPFGQMLAQEYGLAVLDPNDILAALPPINVDRPDGYATFAADPGMTMPMVAEKIGIHEETPAWLYFLFEAKVTEHGQRVGPTASNIIADTIVGLMRAMPQLLLQPESAGWHPKDSPLKGPGDRLLTSLRDFLLYTQTLTRG